MEFHAMSPRQWARRVSFLAAAFAVTAGFAIQGHVHAAAYRRYLTNQRLHAFAELSANLSQLNTDLQKGVYATTPSMLGALCTQIFGRAMSAQMALGELPYGNIELEQTAAFLAKTGDYAAALSRSAAVNGGCTDNEREGLRGLADAAATLSGQVSALQAELLSGGATLEDVDAAEARLSGEEGNGQTTAGSVYQTVEGDFPQLPSLIYDGPFSDHIAGRSPRMLEGLDRVTQEDARLAAARFFDLEPDRLSLVSSGEGELPTYSFSARVDGGVLSVEVTKQGGLVLEAVSSRSAEQAVLSHQEAAALAREFLAARGYPSMAESYFIDQGGVVTINFAATQGEVLCYPDLVKVSVALDTGRVVGFESKGYLMNHTVRDLPAPAVSEEEARGVVSPALTVLSHQLALIPTGGEYEVLCHEFKCEDEDGRHVIVYVNAQNGQEEKLLLLLEDENGTLVL